MKTCAFTGHRPENFIFGYDEENPLCIGIKVAIKKQLCALYDMGYKRFLTGCAKGVDTWAGEAVLDMKSDKRDISLIGAIPFKGQEKGWTDEQKLRYELMLAGCDKIVTIHEKYKKGSYYARDRYMVDNSDTLLAVYDRNYGHSGTGYTVRYALKNDKGVIIIDPLTLESETMNMERNY